MTCAGMRNVGFMALLLGLVFACGEPPKSDFYSPGSASSSGGVPSTAAIATIGSTSTSASTSTSTGTSSSTGGPSSTTSAESTGAGGTSSTATDGASSTGGSNLSCSELPEWDGGNPEFTLEQGAEMQHNGRRYRATEPIEFPNPECAPDAPMDWCAGWFEDLGPCE